MGKFDIYKKGQGKYTRVSTFLVGILVITTGAYWLSEQLSLLGLWVQYGVPVAVWVALAYLLFWLVNKPRTADFMIATEGEMKKVSWSSRREIIGSTKVVIFTTFAMALLLFLVDVLFQWFFEAIDVLQVTAAGT